MTERKNEMKQAIQISFDELGRILIPASAQESLRLTPGMTLIVEKDEQGVAFTRPAKTDGSGREGRRVGC